jgi:hypothetical protein
MDGGNTESAPAVLPNLRHKNAVLRHHAGRIRCEPTDRGLDTPPEDPGPTHHPSSAMEPRPKPPSVNSEGYSAGCVEVQGNYG